MSTDIATKTQDTTRTPDLFKVLLLNDDYTPMEFVIFVLMRFFRQSEQDAQQIMLDAHQKGVAVAGVYTFEVAETKVTQVMRAAQEEEYPLRCVLEPD